MAEILGKVSGSASYEVPRGADVSLQVKVPVQWFTEGRTIEVELPRNLMCARCLGGGCSSCSNSGAITLRGRTELPEVVQVVLPLQRLAEGSEHAERDRTEESSAPDSAAAPDSQPKSARPIVIRIPECGGLPDAANGAIVRGWLLLEVRTAAFQSANVRALDDEDDPLSSSKMLRAEVRTTSGQPAGAAFRGVTASRSIRAPRSTDETAEPPSSRVAKLGSTRPPETLAAGAPVPSLSETHSARASGLVSESGARSDAVTRLAYLALVVLAVMGILALLFL